MNNLDTFDGMVYELMETIQLPLEELKVIDAVFKSKIDIMDTVLTDYMWEMINGREKDVR